MNSPFVLGKKEVLSRWKHLRQSLSDDLSDEEHIEMVMRFWNLAPLSTRVIDWDNPASWPDPWEMINENEYDDSMVSLAMFYTLLLANDQRWSTDRLELMLIREPELCVQRLVLRIDRRWLMNLEYNRPVDATGSTTQSCWVQQRYGYNGKRHFIVDDISFGKGVITSDNQHPSQLNIQSS